MTAQVYPIKKTDWCVTVMTKKAGVKRVRYYYGVTLKEVREWAENKKGCVQFFKMTYEFKGMKVHK